MRTPSPGVYFDETKIKSCLYLEVNIPSLIYFLPLWFEVNGDFYGMSFDRPWRDHQLGCDLLVGQTISQQIEDLQFPVGQWIQ